MINTIKKNKKVTPIVQSKKVFSPHFLTTGKEITVKDYLSANSSYIDIDYAYEEHKEVGITFQLETLPHCCGIHEIGDLSTDINNNNKSKALKGLVEVLDTTASEYTGNTLILNTNGKANSLIFDEALAKCKYWTLVKTFKNKNSGNTIKMWVTNNN